jgi:tyrosinase
MKSRSWCEANPALRYWDWTADWQNLANSSIWDNEEGFGIQSVSKVQKGGKIGVSIPRQAIESNCVSGPFKDITLFHYNLTVHPHCLTREFELTKSEDHGTFSGELMSPDSMGQLARCPDYGTFRYGIEGIHDVIHNGVIGDMNTWSSANGMFLMIVTKRNDKPTCLTAALDPIFWLHHAQLDRLWWTWQQEDPKQRLLDYSRSPIQNSATDIHDDMEYLGLFENRTVLEVMRTNSKLLCYRY